MMMRQASLWGRLRPKPNSCTIGYSRGMYTGRGATHRRASYPVGLAGSVVCLAVTLALALQDSLCLRTEGDSSDLEDIGVSFDTDHTVTNWSSTHSCQPRKVYYPQSPQEVCRVLEGHHRRREKVRPIGTGLSPNGLAMIGSHDLVNLSLIDHVRIDAQRQLVVVGAGTTVAKVLKELEKHSLTLENFSSIQEQQVGGWIQVAAHGTGASLSTVDEMVVGMKLATPTEGLISLSHESNPRLFAMAKVGLGSLGVVTELTLRCIPKHSLMEQLSVVDTKELSAVDHYRRLRDYRHVRYMWLPLTSKVVVVVSNPTAEASVPVDSSQTAAAAVAATSHLCSLLRTKTARSDEPLDSLSFTQLRDRLLELDPLGLPHVREVNQAEAAYWEASSGYRIDDSVNVLGFDCGGQQWVLEVCFPIGELDDHSSGRDLEFIGKLLAVIEERQIPAHCPIEQRWTARSTAAMSPAYSSNARDVFSWVGIIMYLPPHGDQQRRSITDKFREYVRAIEPLVEEFGGKIHWAKLELPQKDAADYDARLQSMRTQLAAKYPLKQFNQYRAALDPHNILSNSIIDELLSDD